MAGIKGVNKIRTKVGFTSKRSTSVPMPKLKGNVSPKKLKDNRIYKKSVLQQDPSLFTNEGFGDTGMSGED
jgi:hypothetical protein